jgi:hypothetical protein
MSHFQPARRIRSTIRAALFVVGGALMGILVLQPLVSQSSSATPFVDIDYSDHHGPPGSAPPDRVTVFDDDSPAVANLEPGLLGALRQAAADASVEGVEFVVNSGWRTPEYQEQLLREAVLEYGSESEAARWVATPNTSAHVSGDAVDIGPSDAAAWLSARGAGYGLCQIYSNEPWHFELRLDAVYDGCAPMYADPTQDPRMQQ